MARIKKKSVAPIYTVGVVWLLWGMWLPLYRPIHYLTAGLVSLAAYLVGRKLIWRDRVIVTPDPEPADRPEQTEEKQEKPREKESTGNPEVEALLKERDLAVQEMRRLNESIEDPKISAQIDHLVTVTGKIIGYVADHPDRQGQIRRFLTYYLPTTIKLLNAYDRMDDVGVSGTNIDGTMGRIETMMETIVTAFDRQLDALFAHEALDISADITVLEQMLAGEGLSGQTMRSEQTPRQ